MSLRLRDHLQWQDATNLDAFITRLTDSDERVRENVRTFVVGEKVRPQLDALLGEMGRRIDDNRDIGRYFYGSFGSGKSHLLTILGKMLEGDPYVYDHGHPALRKLHADNAWLDRHKVLVVRLNMMDKRSLTTALYGAFNDALPSRVPKLAFTDEQRVFERIDLDAQRLGGQDALVRQIATELESKSIQGWPDGMPAAQLGAWIAAARRGDLEARLSLAAAFQNWRNHGQDEIRADDLWLDIRPGLDRIARHAQEHGYTGVAWLIDELIIWIRGKARVEYVQAINTLSAMVDHDAARALPFFVAVAIQQDIARTCPEDMSEQDFQAQLGFIKDRFDPRIQLEDQDLYEVCAQRVLARREDRPAADAAAFEGRISALFENNREAIAAFSGDIPADLVSKLYPFHPALLRILVDVTQALSRNRTAVAALYVLLNRYAEMEPGKFIPVGALWDFVFTNENVQAMRGNATTRFNQRVYEAFDTYQRLEGKIDAVARENSTEPAVLRALVRSTLLCQLSDRAYFTNGQPLRERVTASMLLRLNEADVSVVHERTGIARVANLLRKLQGVALQVQVTGNEADPSIHIKTDQIDYEKVLAQARAKVGPAERFRYIRKLLIEQLGLQLKDGNEAVVVVPWKGTQRKGIVRIRNVRECSYAGEKNEFDPGSHEFLVLVDYPFDEVAGMGRDDDVRTVEAARGRGGTWALSWLPTHFSPSEREMLDNAAAVDEIRKNEAGYFENVAPREADATKRALETYELGRRMELEQAIQRLYFAEGLIAPSRTSLSGVNLVALDRGRAVDALAGHILAKRYPSHPEFKRKVVANDLQQVADWVIRAAKTRQPLDLRAADMGTAESIAVPLELVHKGAGSITPKLDGRYLSAIRAWIGDRRAFEGADLRTRLMAEFDDRRRRDADNWGFGFTKELANLWLLYLLQVEEFEARMGERSTTIAGLSELPDKFRLVKDEVVDSPTWDRAKNVAEKLLDVRGRADLPTSPEQAKLCRDVAEPARTLTTALNLFETRFKQVSGWASVDRDQSARRNAAREIATFVDGVLAESANAARCRRLAAAAEARPAGAKPVIEPYRRIRTDLAAETEALAKIEAMETAFKHIQQRGSDDDKQAVVRRLQNILKDPWDAGSLATLLPTWAADTKRRFEAMLDGKEDEDEAVRKRAEEALRAEEEARRRTEAEEARRRSEAEEARRKAAEDEARRADEARKAAELAREEAERKTREAEEALRRAEEEAKRRPVGERTCEGDRGAIVGLAQVELAAAVAANPGARLRVRIIVETVE